MQGIETFIDALSLYITNNVLVIVFLIAALYILKKSNQKQRKYLIAVAIVAILMVFNGVAFAILKCLGEETTYYRFFWICPIVLASAYLVVEIFFELTVKRCQKIALLIIFGVMLFVYSSQSLSDWWNIPSNVYQLDDDIIELGDLIDEQTGGDRTILLVNDDVSAHIREYNANIISNPDGMYYLDEVINGNNDSCMARNVMMFMDFNLAEYIAVEKEKLGTNRLFESIGCEKVGETEKYNLYFYDYELLAEEWKIFDEALADKSLYVNSEYINVPGMERQKDYLYVTDLWINTSEEQKQAIIELANELQVEALIINSTKSDVEITKEFLEKEFENLQVPYIYNNQGIQEMETEELSMVCMKTEGLSAGDVEKLRSYIALDKAMILVTDKPISISEIYYEQLLSTDSPVVEIIVGNAGSKKEMLNERILLYGAKEVSIDKEQGFVTLLRVKGLERR